MMGSAVFSGMLELKQAWATEDKQALNLRNELSRIGYLGDQPVTAFPISAAFEVHIEQGPVLENADLQIGVVTGVQGLRWYDIHLQGAECHAGPTPMDQRSDPFMILAPVLESCYSMAAEIGPQARVTFGDLEVEPGARNTVPSALRLSVDLRHSSAEQLDKMDERLKEIVKLHCKNTGVKGRVEEVWHMPVTRFNGHCIAAVNEASQHLGYRSLEMVSGAGHDSLNIAKVAPTSMIFIPCEGGLSHNEAENATSADVEAGCNVLLHAMLSMADA